MSVSSVGQSGRLSFPVVTQHHSDSSSIQCDSLSDVFSPTEGVDRLNQTVAHRQDWEDRVAESIQKILVAVEDEAAELKRNGMNVADIFRLKPSGKSRKRKSTIFTPECMPEALRRQLDYFRPPSIFKNKGTDLNSSQPKIVAVSPDYTDFQSKADARRFLSTPLLSRRHIPLEINSVDRNEGAKKAHSCVIDMLKDPFSPTFEFPSTSRGNFAHNDGVRFNGRNLREPIIIQKFEWDLFQPSPMEQALKRQCAPISQINNNSNRGADLMKSFLSPPLLQNHFQHDPYGIGSQRSIIRQSKGKENELDQFDLHSIMKRQMFED